MRGQRLIRRFSLIMQENGKSGRKSIMTVSGYLMNNMIGGEVVMVTSEGPVGKVSKVLAEYLWKGYNVVQYTFFT